MRVLVGLLLFFAAALWTYWAYHADFVWRPGPQVQWIFVSFAGWWVCWGIWHRLVGGNKDRDTP